MGGPNPRGFGPRGEGQAVPVRGLNQGPMETAPRFPGPHGSFPGSAEIRHPVPGQVRAPTPQQCAAGNQAPDSDSTSEPPDKKAKTGDTTAPSNVSPNQLNAPGDQQKGKTDQETNLQASKIEQQHLPGVIKPQQGGQLAAGIFAPSSTASLQTSQPNQGSVGSASSVYEGAGLSSNPADSTTVSMQMDEPMLLDEDMEDNGQIDSQPPGWQDQRRNDDTDARPFGGMGGSGERWGDAPPHRSDERWTPEERSHETGQPWNRPPFAQNREASNMRPLNKPFEGKNPEWGNRGQNQFPPSGRPFPPRFPREVMDRQFQPMQPRDRDQGYEEEFGFQRDFDARFERDFNQEPPQGYREFGAEGEEEEEEYYDVDGRPLGRSSPGREEHWREGPREGEFGYKERGPWNEEQNEDGWDHWHPDSRPGHPGMPRHRGMGRPPMGMRGRGFMGPPPRGRFMMQGPRRGGPDRPPFPPWGEHERGGHSLGPRRGGPPEGHPRGFGRGGPDGPPASSRWDPSGPGRSHFGAPLPGNRRELPPPMRRWDGGPEEDDDNDGGGRPHWDRDAERWDEQGVVPRWRREMSPPSSPPPAPADGDEEGDLEFPDRVMSLSSREHEIILKAAQELKMLREQQEQLHLLNEMQNDVRGVAASPSPSSSAAPSYYRTSLDALDSPAEKPKVDSGGSGWSHGEAPWVRESLAPSTGVQRHDNPGSCPPPLPPPSSSSLLERKPLNLEPMSVKKVTHDYSHSSEVLPRIEQTSYGERVSLGRGKSYIRESLPPGDASFRERCLGWEGGDGEGMWERESMMAIERGPRPPPLLSRDPKDGASKEFIREPLDRERLPLGQPGSYMSYAERRAGPERPTYERKPFESMAPPYPGEHYQDRPPMPFSRDRPPYPPSRMGPPDRRMGVLPPPPPPSSLPPPMAPPPPMPHVEEKKPESKHVDDLLKKPGRVTRPERIVVIMRGLPGSGKTHVAKLIRDKEVEEGGAAPRVLSLDDYFVTEVERTQTDPETKRKVKKKVMEYEYEPEMEETYRSSMLKTFRKTLDDGFFPFIIIDAINNRVKHFESFWSSAKTKGFEVYFAEITGETHTCAKRNTHGRKHDEINKMADQWEVTPKHMIRLDIRSLLQDAAIAEVEMEDTDPSEETESKKTAPTTEEEEGDGEGGYIPKSKWEMDTSEAKLDKLDGLGGGCKRKRDLLTSAKQRMEDYLSLPEYFSQRPAQPGKKRVRWADLEEQSEAERKRAIGFVVGQTDWDRITDESGEFAAKALNRTRYF
ncbi:YLP motif-containing protein 1 isoform X1 [Lethenteron reissneri]|uniref:YLP motif-containing protein 1 isoform X1 n=1 Tax=Lethenteron reissneri TaxID=7753 RepID=UPI002AB69A87|nr:YLP motif-containing protein 1 isoform X1 [Lethenteron reissneri]